MPGKVVVNVLREGACRGVAKIRILLKCLAWDPIKFPAEHPDKGVELDLPCVCNCQRITIKNPREPGAGRRKFGFADQVQLRILRSIMQHLRGKRWLPDEQFIEHRSQGVDVTSGIDIHFRSRLFRAHVDRCTHDPRGIFIRFLCDAEVDDLGSRSAIFVP